MTDQGQSNYINTMKNPNTGMKFPQNNEEISYVLQSHDEPS